MWRTNLADPVETVTSCTQCAQAEADELQALAEIERLEGLLDAMTAALGAAMMRDFGEHSSANDPWANAIRALKGLEA
jgi:hypothetical protein